MSTVPNTTLNAIMIKARRLSRSPSASQISDADLINYVNTFLLYDLPSHLKLSYLRKTFTFYTQPNVDSYTTNDLWDGNPMNNFNNLILTSSDPIYIAGYKTLFSQSREDFYSRWNNVKQIAQIGTGDGITTQFSGILSSIPIVPTETIFTSINSGGFGIGLQAIPIFDFDSGLQTQICGLYDTNDTTSIPPQPITTHTIPAFNTVNNETGSYVLTFSTAPGNGEIINVQSIPFDAARPTDVLFFNDTFTLRPVPDQQYNVTIECYVLPTVLISSGQSPDLDQWWQYIAYGTAKKILEDRLDNETLQLIMPEFKEQEKLVLRRTVEQTGDQRTSTIYTQQGYGLNSQWGWWNQ